MGLQVFRGIGELLTLKGAWAKEGRWTQESDLEVIKKAAMLVQGEHLIWVGPESQLLKAIKSNSSISKSKSSLKNRATEKNKSISKKHELGKGQSISKSQSITNPLATNPSVTKTQSIQKKQSIKDFDEFDFQGATVLPGWIDCHTHTVFGGQRWNEFEMRCQGVSYQEIAKKGGGILSTMRATREESKSKLLMSSQKRVEEFLRGGVTTLEIKSGYGLNRSAEIKQLEVAKALRGPRVITTFLGAHALPPEFSSHEAYLDYLLRDVLPLIKRRQLAQRVDIFVEGQFFTAELARRYLRQVQDLGFEVTIHADQLSLSGGAVLAVELGARSADHVIQLGEKEIKAIAASPVTAVLLPMADLYMKCAYPPARKLIDGGARVALATDFNPGSCPSQDVQLVGLLARLQMQMSLAEVISAWTVGGAFALGLKDVGSLQEGFKADFQVIEDDWRSLFYKAGSFPAKQVFVGGRRVVLDPLGFNE